MSRFLVRLCGIRKRCVDSSPSSYALIVTARDAEHAQREATKRFTSYTIEKVEPFELSAFLMSYLVAALWSSSGGDDCENLDDEYDISDISDSLMTQSWHDCSVFWATNHSLLLEASELGVYSGKIGNRTESLESMAGHDFWLTRAGHGVGFWDRGLDDVGQRLTDATKLYTNIDLYVGDDGKIYGSGTERACG